MWLTIDTIPTPTKAYRMVVESDISRRYRETIEGITAPPTFTASIVTALPIMIWGILYAIPKELTYSLVMIGIVASSQDMGMLIALPMKVLTRIKMMVSGLKPTLEKADSSTAKKR